MRGPANSVPAGIGLAELAPPISSIPSPVTKAVFDGRNRPFRIRDCVRAEATDLHSITIDAATFSASKLRRFNVP